MGNRIELEEAINLARSYGLDLYHQISETEPGRSSTTQYSVSDGPLCVVVRQDPSNNSLLFRVEVDEVRAYTGHERWPPSGKGGPINKLFSDINSARLRRAQLRKDLEKIAEEKQTAASIAKLKRIMKERF